MSYVRMSVRNLRHILDNLKGQSALVSQGMTCATYSNGPISDSADVVVCGGGVTGLSICLHLKLKGWDKVVLVDQGRY